MALVLNEREVLKKWQQQESTFAWILFKTCKKFSAAQYHTPCTSPAKPGLFICLQPCGCDHKDYKINKLCVQMKLSSESIMFTEDRNKRKLTAVTPTAYELTLTDWLSQPKLYRWCCNCDKLYPFKCIIPPLKITRGQYLFHTTSEH